MGDANEWVDGECPCVPDGELQPADRLTLFAVQSALGALDDALYRLRKSQRTDAVMLSDKLGELYRDLRCIATALKATP